MSMPFNPAAQQGNGFRQMGGGYEAAISQANGQGSQQQQQTQQPMQQQLVPQPIQNQMNLPPQMQVDGGGSPLPFMNQQAAQQRQAQQQLQAPPQFQQSVQPGQRFGDGAQQFQQQPFVPQLQQQQANLFSQQMQQVPQQQQIQAPAGLDLGTRLTGPNIPADLQGRTVGEAIAIHNGMRQVHMQMMSQQQGAPSIPQPQTQQPQQQAQSPTQGAPGTAWDWRDPSKNIAAVVGQQVDERMGRLEAMLAPTIQSAHINSIQQARNAAAAEIGPAFTQMEPLILQSLQGIDPRALTNPQTWRVAAERAVGALALQQSRQQPVQPQQSGPGMYPQQMVQPGQQPLPNLNSFFSEQPNQGGPGAQGFQLTQQQMGAADAMGISHADYAAYYNFTAPRQQSQGGYR